MYQRKLERVIEKGKPFANVRQRKSEKSREFQCFTLALAWFLSVKCRHLKTSNFLNNENNCNVKKRKKYLLFISKYINLLKTLPFEK